MASNHDPLTRFMLATDREPGGHWLWKRAIDPTGYGRFSVDGRMLYAHRWAYGFFVEPIPEGRQIDHLCRVRHCVYPPHLEVVTQQENLRRGGNAAKTHCIHGHEFSAENTYVNPDGRRSCRACRRDALARHRRNAA